MSKSIDRAAKLASLDIDDTPSSPVSDLLKERAKTAPGQLMMIQGDLKRAEERADELQRQLDAGAPRAIPLSEIYLVPGRQRMLSPEEKAELKENLRLNPLLHPVTVRPKNERGYELVSGYNRYNIYLELGRREIEAHVKELEADKVEIYAFYANLLSPSLPDFEKYLGFKKRQAATGYSQKQLAEESGISPKSLSALFTFDDFPEEAKEILAGAPDVLGIRTAQKFIAAIKSGRHAQVITALQRLCNREEGFTQANAIAYVNSAQRERNKEVESRVIRVGRAQFCKLDARRDTVLVKFTDEKLVREWLPLFEEFVKSTLKNKEEK
jgi:ParB family chromosome partitioning protein